MINKAKIYGLLGLSAKAGKIAIGADACMEAVEKRKAKLVIVAEDAADRTKFNFQTICEKKNIPFYIVGNIEEISKSIGKSNKAVIVVKDMNFTNAIIKNINGGEVIG